MLHQHPQMGGVEIGDAEMADETFAAIASRHFMASR